MDLFNFWTVATIAVAGYYIIEYKKAEKMSSSVKEVELEERIKALEEKSK